MLPIEEKYLPALKIQVRDQRAFGRKPVVGSFVLDNIESYLVDPPAILHKPATPPEPAPGGFPADQRPAIIEVSVVVQVEGSPSTPTDAAVSGEQHIKDNNGTGPKDELNLGTVVCLMHYLNITG